MKPITSVLFLLCSLTMQAQDGIQGRTTGTLPYLKYGLGSDRLGGAKMTYLDTNVLIKVIDSAGSDYKVMLSNHHFAYLPKQNFSRD